MQPPSSWYLAIDLGTGGVKVAAVLEDGSVVADQFATIETTVTLDGGSTQDPAHWWSAIVGCVSAVLAQLRRNTLNVESVRPGCTPGCLGPRHSTHFRFSALGTHTVSPDACRAVGITGQWGSTVPVDADGLPVGPCLLWADDRGVALSSALVGGRVQVQGLSLRKAASWVRFTGGMPSPGGADPTGHALWLRHHDPGVYRDSATFLEPVDYVGLLLTGRMAATPASMVLSWLTDNRPGAPLGYREGLLRLAQRDRAKLPELLPTGSVLGPRRSSVAHELGLPDTVPVVTGVPDLHTAWLGSGAVSDYQGHIAISTTAWVSAAVPFKRTDALRSIASIPSIAPGSYLIANNHDTGGACLRWFREQILGNGQPSAATPSYDDITTMASGVPSGSGGVIFAPWLKGERSPVDDRNLRASFLNVSLQTTQSAMARSVLEGVAYNARWLLEATEKFAKRPLSVLRILGGGAQSDMWCQIHADVIGRPVERVESPLHTNVRGAALFAAVSLGHCSLSDAGSRSRVDRTFVPHPPSTVAHDPLYREFVRLAKSQKQMYARLNRR